MALGGQLDPAELCEPGAALGVTPVEFLLDLTDDTLVEQGTFWFVFDDRERATIESCARAHGLVLYWRDLSEPHDAMSLQFARANFEPVPTHIIVVHGPIRSVEEFWRDIGAYG